MVVAVGMKQQQQQKVEEPLLTDNQTKSSWSTNVTHLILKRCCGKQSKEVWLRVEKKRLSAHVYNKAHATRSVMCIMCHKAYTLFLLWLLLVLLQCIIFAAHAQI